MRVLLPVFTNQIFALEQVRSISQYWEVETSRDAFWDNDGNFDIVLLNWPEELTEWKEPTNLELAFVRRVLQRWAETSRIVVVRHNFHPHYADTEPYRKLYDIVYQAAHGVVHMGHFSAAEFEKRYAKYDFLGSQAQTVIPHPIFAAYPDNVTRDEARRCLGIKRGAFMLLAFGRVQSAAEKNLVINAFSDVSVRDKIALVPGWKKTPGKEPVDRLRWLILSSSRRFKREGRHVPEGEVATLFRAADLVLIARTNVLNSGLIPLGIKFDSPMVVPECGNLRELGEALGCSLFDPDSRRSLRDAVRKSIRGSTRPPDYSQFRELFNTEAIARKYVAFFSALSPGSRRAQ